METDVKLKIRTLTTAIAAGALITPALLAGTATFAAAQQRPALAGDFNGDGRRDVVIGSPAGTVSSLKGAGFVTVVYGGASGPDVTNRQIISQNNAGVPGTAETGDFFGGAVASADFDQDGFADLAVGAPREGTTAEEPGKGRLSIIYGGEDGLSGRSVELTTGDTPASVGEHLAVGDFNGNGRADLVTTEDSAFWTFADVGAGDVTGRRTPLAADDPAQGLYWATPVAGDFTGDGHADLAILRADSIDGLPSDAAVELRLGSPSGLGSPRTLPVAGRLGVAGDINGDGRSDLITNTDEVEGPYTGRIHVRLGTASGLGSPTRIDQATAGVPGTQEDGDAFGDALAVGDINGDGRADAAIGAPGEDISTKADAGAVTVLYGGATGLTTAGAQQIGQDSSGVPGTSEANDHFGSAVALNNVRGDGKADLTGGAAGEDGTEGRVLVFTGTATSGITTLATSALGIGGRNAQLGQVLLP